MNSLDQAKHAAILEQFDGGGSINLERDESTGIATLLINNPQKKNALSGKEGSVSKLESGYLLVVNVSARTLSNHRF